MSQRLYADNAATSFPKPQAVFDAMRIYADELGASAGRGAYREAIETGELLNNCRRKLAALIRAADPRQIIFTHNCSMALNQAIKGVLRPGDHVVATTMEHNSVLRPLHGLMDSGAITVDFVPVDPQTTRVDPARVAAALRPNTRLVSVVHASNVTGALQPIESIGQLLKSRGALFLVDAAQSAGHVPIDVQAMNIDLLALPGHKGLMGPLGTGALYIRPGLESEMTPLMEGGTGSVSELPTQPAFMPDKFESGSHNAIGIAGLNAALEWLESTGVQKCRAHDVELSRAFLDACRSIPSLTVYGPEDPQLRVAVFSVRVEGLDAGELSALLETEFGILSRPGLHCAPLAHRAIDTDTTGGTTRLSFGFYNSREDVIRCVDALGRLAAAGAPA